jgi:hypothetical protein
MRATARSGRCMRSPYHAPTDGIAMTSAYIIKQHEALWALKAGGVTGKLVPS